MDVVIRHASLLQPHQRQLDQEGEEPSALEFGDGPADLQAVEIAGLLAVQVLFGDGRVVLNTEVHPFYSDPLTDIRAVMQSPRIAWSNPGDTTTQLIPVHPMDAMQKATVTTGDGAAYNAIFGAVAVVQVIQQQNAFAAMPSPRRGARR